MDAELLIAHVLGKNRTWVIAHGEEKLNLEHSEKIQLFLKRRESGEPLAYITGTKEFYGRKFIVDESVLIPRPATESLIDDCLKFMKGETPLTHEIDSGISAYIKRFQSNPIETIIDVGTGSGCIAITLSLSAAGTSRPGVEIIGIDTSKEALSIAEKNKIALGAPEIEFIHADGIEFIKGFDKPFLLVSNPPYIPVDTAIDSSVKDFEPHEALFAGEKGMNVIGPLIEAAKNNPECVGMIIEMRNDQTKASVAGTRLSP